MRKILFLFAFFMVYFSEYKKQTHNDFRYPIFSHSKAQIFTFGEVKKEDGRGHGMESEDIDTGKIPISAKLKSF